MIKLLKIFTYSVLTALTFCTLGYLAFSFAQWDLHMSKIGWVYFRLTLFSATVTTFAFVCAFVYIPKG